MSLAKKIDHLAIAVNDVDAAVKAYTTNFAFPVEAHGDLPEMGIRRAHLRIGDATLEILKPLKEEHPVTKFIAERGEGLYLLSLEVENLDAAAKTLGEKGIGVKVQEGGGVRMGFISPKHTHGVLLQLIQR